MLDIYGTLEIERVLQEITSFSKTEIGIAKVKALRMLSEEEASKALKLLSQMSDFTMKYGAVGHLR